MQPEPEKTPHFYPPKLEERRRATNQLFNWLTTLLFYFCILLFIISFKFTDTPLPFGWYQQFMPGIGSRQITDITFLDSLTGFAVVSRNVNPDTASILKTTDGGDNWQIVFTQTPRRFSRIKFINQNTGFICGGTGSGLPQLYKTTNAGLNWSLHSSFGCAYWNDMAVLDENTIWLVDADGSCGGVFYTSNGGGSWQQQVNLFGSNPDRIYMFNARIGFFSRTSSTQLYKTTNSGQNWNLITGIGTGSFNDMYFVDSLTGWKCKTVGGGGWLMGKSTDGGFNWINQQLPFGGNISIEDMEKFDNVNKDTIWGVGAYILYPGSGFRGMIYKTVNGGNNWLFQVPDTSIPIGEYNHIDFANKLNGWAYRNLPTGVHTNTGGDTIDYLPIKQISSEVPKEYKLEQNFPNPFNPKTKIKASLTPSEGGKQNIKLVVYDITGKEILVLINEQLSAGTYEIDFDGTNYSSGVYFYSLIIDGKIIDTKKMLMIK